MAIFTGEIKEELINLIGELPKEINIAFFGSELNCRSCKDTKLFIEEFGELNDKIHVQYYDLEKDAELANELGVDKVPSMVVLDDQKKTYGMRFYGIPAGYEIHSLISSVRELSGISADLPEEIEQRIAALEKDVHIRVFVTPTCPYCPGAVITGHRLAMLNERISADAIEANSFPDESERFSVRGVPKIVINDKHEFVGSQPITKFLELIDTL